MNGQKTSPIVAARILCFLLLLLPLMLPLPKNTDPKSAFINGLFYYGMIVGGTVGSVFAWKGYFIKKARPNNLFDSPAIVAPLPPGAIESGATGAVNPWEIADAEAEAVTLKAFDLANPAQPYRAFPYASTRKKVIACEWYASLHHRSSLPGLLGLPAFLSLFFTGGFFSGYAAGSAMKIAAVFAGWFIFLFIVGMVSLLKRFPRTDTLRSATIVLTSEGIYDVMSEKQHFAPWNLFAAIRTNETGTFLFQPQGVGYIPKGDFAGGASAEADFYQAVYSLWKSGGAEWPDAVPPIVP